MLPDRAAGRDTEHDEAFDRFTLTQEDDMIHPSRTQSGLRPLQILLLVPAAMLAIGLTGCPGGGDGNASNNGTNNGAAEICDDGVDNDGNGDTDCDDAACATDAACDEPECTTDDDCEDAEVCDNGSCAPDGPDAEVCDDGVDNDGDGDADCEDSDCDGDPACEEPDCTNDDDCEDGEVCDGGECVDGPPEPEVCDDGVDNDDDGDTDCADDDCADDLGCQIATCRDVCTRVASCDEFILACGEAVATQAEMDCQAGCEDDEGRPQILAVAAVPCDVVTPLAIDGFGLTDICIFEAEICDDGADNDGDEATDCDDDDCVDDAACIEICDDGADNDQDEAIDCLDTDCADALNCQIEICDDGQDNNGDDAIDCDDEDCDGDPACLGDATPIAVVGETIVLTGTLDADDPTFTRRNANCTPRDTDSQYYYEGLEIVNTLGVDTAVEVTAHWLGAEADGYLFVYGRPLDLETGCVVGDDDFAIGDLPSVAGSQVAQVDIAAGQFLTILATTFDPLDAIGDFEITVLTLAPPESICDDGMDDDNDGDIDCEDLDCQDDAACHEEGDECADNIDNDGDDAADCADSDCFDAPNCQEVCDDNIDNDLDEDTDCDDTDCRFDPACVDTAICDAPPALILDSPATGTLDEGQDSNFRGSCAGASGPEAVYALTVAEAGSFCLHTEGSDIDTVLYVRTPDCVGEDGEVACDDDGGPGVTSSIELDATPGTYYVFVDSFSFSLGAYTLNARAGTCVENSCDDGNDDDNDGDTDCADSDCVDAPNCQEVCDDNIDNDLDELTDCEDLDDCGADPACIEICDNNTDDNNNQLTDCEEPTCFGHPACAGEFLGVAAQGESVSTSGTLDDQDLQWDRVGATCLGDGPADHFFDAIALTNATGADQIVNVTAQWFGENADGYLHAFADPWDIVNLDDCLFGDDDAVIDGQPLRAGSQMVNLEIADGQTLVILASAFSADDPIGDYTLTVDTQLSPEAQCEAATVDTITAEGTYNGDTSENPASRYSGTCGGSNGPEDVYALTVDAETTVCADTFGTTYDTVLYVRADCTDADSQISCNDDTNGLQSQVEFTAMPGTTYSIFVDSFGGSGLYALNVGFGACVQE